MPRDDAVSNAAAVLMMIATVTGVSAAVFLHVFYGAPTGPVNGMRLDPAGPMPDPITKEFRVSNVTGAFNWSAVTVELEGSALHYGLTKSTGYCVSPEGLTCIEADEWLPNKLPVKVGQHLTIQGPDLRGKKVVLVMDGKPAWEGFVNV